ncbi:hypothetical protein BC937DRAFT_88921 [Endogone sp. FLAS-F59071]|nr:hypothetical protein BC937DRAFT_88921 [Endogone sp. FLAS-F59071]|eukprot:RUS22472.1 hypothetical protein BC937DRAFT_88921 [Endogone sp. FLAS-F59071]
MRDDFKFTVNGREQASVYLGDRLRETQGCGHAETLEDSEGDEEKGIGNGVEGDDVVDNRELDGQARAQATDDGDKGHNNGCNEEVDHCGVDLIRAEIVEDVEPYPSWQPVKAKFVL